MRRRRNIDIPLILGLIVLGCIFSRFQSSARSAGTPDPISNVIRKSVEPAAALSSSLAGVTVDFFSGLGQSTRLVEENAKLRGDLAGVKIEASNVADLQSQIEELRRMGGWVRSGGREKIPADVIGYYPKEFRLTLNVGKAQGVQVGMPVAVYEGYIGRVETVGSSTCQALLVTAPSSDAKMGAIVRGSPKKKPVAGLIRSNSGSLDFELANPEDRLLEGDVVITGGFSNQIPRGLAIGIVSSVESDPVYGKKIGHLAPAATASSLREVVVIR